MCIISLQKSRHPFNQESQFGGSNVLQYVILPLTLYHDDCTSGGQSSPYLLSEACGGQVEVPEGRQCLQGGAQQRHCVVPQTVPGEDQGGQLVLGLYSME